MKIKIVFPKKDGDPGAMGVTMPYVLPHLAALTPAHHKVELVNLFREKLDLADRPDLVAISVMTPMAVNAYALADEYRAKGIPVILGGHHASAMPHEAKGHADAVVIGEAEETWPEVIKDFERGGLKEFYTAGPVADGEELPEDETFKVIGRPSLDSIPLPRRDLLKHRYLFDSIVTTRGCQYMCRFCGTSRFYGGTVRHRPVESVVEEVGQMGRFFLMADDDIFGDLPYRLSLYEKMDGMKRFMRWHGAGSLAVASSKDGDDVLRLSARSGLNQVFVGLESAEPETLRSARITPKLKQTQDIDFGKTVEAIKKIKSYGILVAGFFVLGFDTDTKASFEKTLDLCDMLGVIPIPFLLMPLPGTPLWDDYKERLLPGITWNRWDAVHAVFDHPNIGVKEREELLYRLRRSSYTAGRIFKRLKGYSPGAAMFSLPMQYGIRRSFESDWRRVNSGI